MHLLGHCVAGLGSLTDYIAVSQEFGCIYNLYLSDRTRNIDLSSAGCCGVPFTGQGSSIPLRENKGMQDWQILAQWCL